MGYQTDLNTLLGLPKEFDINILEIGKKYTITRKRERSFPLHIAILIVTHDWQFVGYGEAVSTHNYNGECDIEFKVLTLFDEDTSKIYKNNFLNAAKMTGELN